jgi:hypothetical protein
MLVELCVQLSSNGGRHALCPNQEWFKAPVLSPLPDQVYMRLVIPSDLFV